VGHRPAGAGDDRYGARLQPARRGPSCRARSAAEAAEHLMTNVLSFDNVTVTARMSGRSIDVLRDISFTLAQGGIVGLVGESGAGKSMIGRVVSGLLPDNFSVSAGSITFDGVDLLSLGKRARRALLGRRIAFIPQEPLSALNPVRTIGSQFSEHLRHIGIER